MKETVAELLLKALLSRPNQAGSGMLCSSFNGGLAIGVSRAQLL